MVRVAVGPAGRAGVVSGGKRRTHFDPLHQIRDLPVTQLFLRRHFQIFVDVPNRADEQAFVWQARRYRWAGVAAFHQRFAGIDAEAVKLFGRAMAFLALFDQEGPNGGLKKPDLLGRERRIAGGFASGEGETDNGRQNLHYHPQAIWAQQVWAKLRIQFNPVR
jgi:hypothetical protein